MEENNKTDPASAGVRSLEKNIVYAMLGEHNHVWKADQSGNLYVSNEDEPDNRKPTVEDFSNPRYKVIASTIDIEMRLMKMHPATYQESARGYPRWYLFNGEVYSDRALYTYMQAFYPQPLPLSSFDSSYSKGSDEQLARLMEAERDRLTKSLASGRGGWDERRELIKRYIERMESRNADLQENFGRP